MADDQVIYVNADRTHSVTFWPSGLVTACARGHASDVWPPQVRLEHESGPELTYPGGADEAWVAVEVYDAITGEWANLGEARDRAAALERIAGLAASDADNPQRYRVVETRITTREPTR